MAKGMKGSDLIARALQKRDKTRVALRKSSCGAVMIDGLTFTISAESDGAANKEGIVFTLSGDAVKNGTFTVDMVDIVYPTNTGTRTIKRKPEFYEKKDGAHLYRMPCPEIRIPECQDPDSLMNAPRTEEDLMNSVPKQIIFRFTPNYKEKEDCEIMINIYPAANPLEGACTEWVTATSDREFFEHGGLRKLMDKKH